MSGQLIEDKADKYLADGRVSVLEVSDVRAAAEVRGSETYLVQHVGVWVCSCPARVDRCAHVVAVSKVIPREEDGSVHLGVRDTGIDYLLGV